MNQFKKLNNIIGWLVFIIASTVYIITSEPTASLWDCGEYIATAYKLQVGHPPGAPFFQLVGNFFSLFAPSTEYVARMVNTMSALASAFTILFLFWTITHFARKILVKKEGDMDSGNMIAILASGVVGALAYTFTDSFWFSAVEGEVYAMSSFFTAIVFWAMLKWEDVADKRHGFRWLILISYLMGLSIGVHLLNLLTIPAVIYIYYFKKYQPTTKGIVISGVLSVIMLALVMYGVIPWVVILAGWFERFFVNSIGLPFHWGSFVYFIVMGAGIAYGIYYTQKNKKLVANTILLGFTFLIIGYSSFFILVIRSNANTPIDENNPEDANSLLAYLNREQYGDRPLFYGPYFVATQNGLYDPSNPAGDKSPVYTKSYCVVNEDNLESGTLYLTENKKSPGLIRIFQYENQAIEFIEKTKGKNYSIKQSYVITDIRNGEVPHYRKEFSTIFPRMYSGQRNHPSVYKTYISKDAPRVRVMVNGETKTYVIPKFSDNVGFFFRYQVGWMYMRYFMWNFAGRQNDIQGHGGKLHGNWVSGIDFIDNARIGDQSDLPIDIQNNKAHNNYYFLPLLLGLLGLVFLLQRDYKDGIVVLALFIFTGLAIVVYLNQYPYQPRERDYAYVASFYAFAIWIGLGVLALYATLKKYLNPQLTATAVGLLTLVLVPGVLAQQNWDDHDRSGRYNTLNVANNYLNSCAPNAILFTNGDNDTFPLWYAQEVEGVRTDIKIVNLSLFNTDWYVDQMRRKTYDAEPIPLNIERDKYIQGTNDYSYLFVDKRIKGITDNNFIELQKLMKFYFSGKNKIKYNDGVMRSYIPTKHFSLAADKEHVLANGTVALKDSAKIVDRLEWSLGKSVVQKNDLMMMDMLASFNWDRPIYYAITTGGDTYLGLTHYFQLEGLAYRLVPIKTASGSIYGSYGSVNTDILYENMMNKFSYDGLNDPNLYFDEHHMRSIRNYRSTFVRLSDALLAEGKNEKAKLVLDKCVETLPEHNVPYDYFMIPIASGYYRIGEIEKANEILNRLVEIFSHDLNYFFVNSESPKEFSNEKRNALFILQETGKMARNNKQTELADYADQEFMKYAQTFQNQQQ
ncbi:MAG: hypothetical protein DRI84_02570 [Bacteroidetes bacterium]|nr:MAG: hypothetical protein DRI84_02570 [Bacteroidota bacterium]